MRYNKPRPNRFRSRDKGFRRNGSQDLRTGSINSASNNFQGRSFNRSGLSGLKAEKLLEKYNDLAKVALTNGDNILSESYYKSEKTTKNKRASVYGNWKWTIPNGIKFVD